MQVKIRMSHPDAKLPTYAKPGDAGMDMYCTDFSMDDYGNYVYYTGIHMEIPTGYVGLIFPRSSISKTGLSLRNSVGVIDSGYRGEIMFKFSGNSSRTSYEIGDRIGQIIIMPYPQVEFVEQEELSETERGVGGYGSTGS